MKGLSLLVLLFAASCVSVQFGPGPYPPLARFGMLAFGDTVQVDQTEILLREWIDYIQNSNPEQIPSFMGQKKLSDEEKELIVRTPVDKSLLPDSTYPHYESLLDLLDFSGETIVLSGPGSSGNANLVLNGTYFSNETACTESLQLLNSPVTALSYEQAIEFCKWRTRIDSLRYGKDSSPYLKFDLMSEAHFIAFTFPLDSTNQMHDRNFNYSTGSLSYWKQYSSDLAHCHEGLWDMFGNASEMLKHRGQSIGGSFNSTASDCIAQSTMEYSIRSPEVGFRCIARIAN